MHQRLYEISKERAKHVVWIMSDLQQSDPAAAERCLNICMADYERLGFPARTAWYLGDAVESDDLSCLEEMAAMQAEAFERLGITLCYATGNHDYDYSNGHPDKKPVLPFYETVQKRKDWYTTQNCDDFSFEYKLGDFTVHFFCDHVAKDNAWCVTHGRVKRGAEAYPYSAADAEKLRDRMASAKGPVITAGHYSFPGGNRRSELMRGLFPLPTNVRIHFYGHAHIGDFKWAREDAYRRISWVDWHDIPQINVSSFENVRGDASRSVLLHIHEDGVMGIFFRNHDSGAFTESYFPAMENKPHGLVRRKKNMKTSKNTVSF